jgi:uncharacterized repeat protein (TIGR03803 family)
MKETWAIPLGLLLLAVPAAQAQFTYTTNNGTLTIASYTGSGGAVTIPSWVNGLPVTGIAGYAISDFFHTSITVTIPGSVTSIGDYAFEFDYNLPRVNFEGNAPSVGPNVFFSDALFGGTHTAYYFPGTTGWGSTVGAGVPTMELTGITNTANPTNGVVPLTVSFTSAGVDSASNTVNNWNWNFGDGSTSAAQNPSHTYTNGGTFSVALFETNDLGFPMAGSVASITVSLPTLAFTANPTNGVVPLRASFASPDVDSGGSAITSWNWSFGDGSNSTAQNTSHTYIIPGTFFPALIVTNNIGLTVTASGPASSTVAPPTLAFTANPTNGVESLTVSFASPDVDSGGSAITSWNWNFGDESTSTAQNPSHTYIIPGTFSPALIVTNNIGLTVTGSGPSITVSPLTVRFAANPTNGALPLAVAFTSAGFDSASNTITSWNWNFGDGSASTAQNPSHSYANSGTFSPALIATNNIGDTVIGSGPSITVSPLTVAFTANPTNGTIPLTVGFTSAAVDNGGNIITSWNWNFGDGSASTVQNPSHTYTNVGTFPLALTATNNIGLSVAGSGPASLIALLAVPQYTNFNVLHTFAGNDGAYPYAGPNLSGNTLYGTTEYSIAPISGTVFSLNNATLNFEDLVHLADLLLPNDFENYDGANPRARVILSGNTLYGTTSEGGQDGYGNVFSVNTETLGLTAVHVFNIANSDGITPEAALVLAGDTLYGTATYGGSNSYGTVFSLNTLTLNFTTIHTFTGSNDGAFPWGDLIVSGNTLYGTANGGGSSGYGTVFSVNTNGSNFMLLHSFTGGSDGAYPPQGGLLLSSNTLYGAAAFGGSNGFGTNGYGALFSVNTNASNFMSLYSFTGGADGAYPGAGLVISGRTLYGAAFGGGAAGNGTIFSLDLISAHGSNLTMLYAFTAYNNADGTNSDGANPQPGLVLSGNMLYGAARNGGNHGYGTVFVLPLHGAAPAPIPLNIQLYGGWVVLSWNDPASAFSLQSAPALTGLFTNIPNAIGPYTNIITGAQQFFRLMANSP